MAARPGGSSTDGLPLRLSTYSVAADSDSSDEETAAAVARCCCCTIDTQIAQPARWFRLQQAVCRMLGGFIYLVFILLAVRRVNHVVTKSSDKHEMAWTIGGAFVVATVPISLYQIFQHLSHFVEPRQQTHVIRMISMVPLYAIQSWFSLRYPWLSLYTQCLRELYEAYVIYAFVQYLISHMGNEEQLVMKLQTKPAVLGKHMVPFCCLPPWSMGAEFLTKCKIGVLQYLGVRLFTMLLTFVLENLNLYGEGDYSIKKGFFWVTIINCSSQTWALYILILFYHATHKELISINPCGKFFSIKSVVFASWWQSLLIGLMVHQGTIGELDSHSAEMVARGVQDLLICTEMLMAAIAFTFTFPITDFVPTCEVDHWDYTAEADVDHKGGGSSMGSAGGVHQPMLPGASLGHHGAGEGPEVVSIWTALWTSCVPMDVREDFRLATHQCMADSDNSCPPRCWPCRCKIRCGSRPGAGTRSLRLGAGGSGRHTPRSGGGGGLGGSGSGGMMGGGRHLNKAGGAQASGGAEGPPPGAQMSRGSNRRLI